MEEKKEKIININTSAVIKMLLADKRKVCIYSCVAGVIGLLIAFTTPKVYKSTVMLAPEESGGGFSGSISNGRHEHENRPDGRCALSGDLP